METLASKVRNGTAPLLIIALIISSCLLTSASAAPSSERLRLTILHTNDIHAHDAPFLDRGKWVGGISRIGHLIKSFKQNDPNVLAVDAGDVFQGTPYFKFYHGEAEIESLNLAGYDIFALGNHEFDEGSDNLATQVARAKFDVLCSNLDMRAKPELDSRVKPSVVKEIGGQKVAFVGAVTPSLSEVSLNLQGVKVKSPGKEWTLPVKEEVERLANSGINKIVLVTHCGVEADKELALAIPQVDAIVGGHSHTRLQKPVLVERPGAPPCPIVQTGCYGRSLGKFDLEFDGQGNLVMPNIDYRLIAINARLPENQAIKAYLQEKAKPFAQMERTIVGIALGNFDNAFRRYTYDSPIGDLVSDALLEEGAKYGATIAFQNRGGIRGRIEHGLISQAKVEEILPFDNKLVIATIKGADLLAVMENSVSGNLGARFLDVAGLRVSYDPSKEPGHRLVSAYAQDADGKWNLVEAEKSYRVAINSYSFNGGEGYDFSRATDVVTTSLRVGDVMMEYLKAHKKVAPAQPSRIIAIKDGVLKVDRTKVPPTVQPNGLPAGTLVTYFTGTGPGITATMHGALVPLKNPRVVMQTRVGTTSGSWSASPKLPKGTLVSAIVKLPGPDERPIATAPIEL